MRLLLLLPLSLNPERLTSSPRPPTINPGPQRTGSPCNILNHISWTESSKRHVLQAVQRALLPAQVYLVPRAGVPRSP